MILFRKSASPWLFSGRQWLSSCMQRSDLTSSYAFPSYLQNGSITHVPWLQASVRVSCHCCPFLTVIRLTVFLSSVMQLAFGFPLENMEVVVSILEQMLLHYDYGFDRSFTGWVLLTVCPHRQHHFTLLLDLRCCTRGAEVLRGWASARRQCKPECLWPCAHEAFQSSEELVHIWLLSLPLAVSVSILRLIIILLNCSLALSLINSGDTASCAASLAC